MPQPPWCCRVKKHYFAALWIDSTFTLLETLSSTFLCQTLLCPWRTSFSKAVSEIRGVMLDWLKRFFRPLVFIWRGFSLSDGSRAEARQRQFQLSQDSSVWSSTPGCPAQLSSHYCQVQQLQASRNTLLKGQCCTLKVSTALYRDLADAPVSELSLSSLTAAHINSVTQIKASILLFWMLSFNSTSTSLLAALHQSVSSLPLHNCIVVVNFLFMLLCFLKTSCTLWKHWITQMLFCRRNRKPVIQVCYSEMVPVIQH